MSRSNFKFLQAGLLALLLAAWPVAGSAPAQTNLDPATAAALAAVAAAGSNAPALNGTSVVSGEILKSYLQIQEQLRETQQAIEQNRQDNDAAAVQNAEALDKKLNAIEEARAEDRLKDLETIQQSTKFISSVGLFAAVAFVVLLFTYLLQWRAMNHLRVTVTTQALGASPLPAALGMGDMPMQATSAVEQSATRLLETIERLEKRIVHMEHTLQAPRTPGEPADGNETNGKPAPAEDVQKELVTVMLGKGQTLLKVDQVEAALACFEEVLALDATNAEALVKKGTALERLDRLDEAVACYDRAIATGNAVTMAWLHKGGVYNRLERYNEALECYEKALKTRDAGQLANGHN